MVPIEEKKKLQKLFYKDQSNICSFGTMESLSLLSVKANNTYNNHFALTSLVGQVNVKEYFAHMFTQQRFYESIINTLQ